jgi:cell division septation protein DedD
VSSWEPQRVEDATRKPSAAAPAKPARAATAVAAPKASAPSAAGPYRIMLAAVRSRSEAEAMAQAVRKDEAAALGSRSFEIIEETYGNMGRFYRVRIGMFGHPTEALAVCSTLRQKRIDCMMLDH